MTEKSSDHAEKFDKPHFSRKSFGVGRWKHAWKHAPKNAWAHAWIHAAMHAAAALALVLPLLSAHAVIYGDDDRRDLDQVRDRRLARLAEAVPSFFFDDRIRFVREAGIAVLTTQTLADRDGVCRDENFALQPAGSFFSGALVGPDLVVTAGHAIHDQAECERVYAVFGFDTTAEKMGVVPAENAYRCVELVAREKVRGGPDYSILRLERAVEDRQPLKLRRSGRVAVGAPLVVMGYPRGLPLKVAGGAHVLGEDGPNYLVADTDTFVGNSGSPVMNARTGAIEGILVNGTEPDYVDDARSGCKRLKRCGPGECSGEILTRVESFADRIP